MITEPFQKQTPIFAVLSLLPQKFRHPGQLAGCLWIKSAAGPGLDQHARSGQARLRPFIMSIPYESPRGQASQWKNRLVTRLFAS